MKLPVHLDDRLWFPDPRSSVSHGLDEGLVAVGGDLSVERLLLAYRNGIFPWTTHPLTWWSPNPRAIFELDGIHISRSLASVLRKRTFEITVDLAFQRVMQSCGAGRSEGTWITREFIAAYTRLNEQGHAHSVECWQQGELVGGIYGVAVGGLFAGESMFHRVSNASKAALCHLAHRLRERGFRIFDIQMITPVTAALGAVELPREEYLRRLREAVQLTLDF